MLEILLIPALVGLCIATLAGPFGCFLVWRRMAFFGDTLAHGALPGVALALWLNLDITLTVVITSALLVILLIYLQGHSMIPTDTLLAVLAHSALAAGILGVVLAGSRGPGLESFLIGDLLSAGTAELAGSAICAAALGALLLRYWRAWLALTVNEEQARIDGLAVDRLRLVLLLATAVLIALAIRTVGVLLVSALLILPAAAVRKLVTSPEAMAVAAALVGCLSVIGGLAGSWAWDTPAGPSIVVAASLQFVLIQLFPGYSWPGKSVQ